MKKEKTIGELAREHPNKTYNELDKMRQEAGVCIMAEARKDREEQDEPDLFDQEERWKDMYEKEHKLRQEAEGETTIVKGIGMNSPEMKAAQARVKELEEGLANALGINGSHQKLNGKLQERLTEVEEENKKMHDHINKTIDASRKAGM